MKVRPTLWTYQLDGKWFGHVDWKDNSRLRREGPFTTQAQAAVIISRKNGMEPPEEMLAQCEQDQQVHDSRHHPSHLIKKP